MSFFALSFPMGSFSGIPIRLHFTFFIYAFARLQQAEHIGWEMAFIIGLYFSILLHEFGHILTARFCDGDAKEVILWPLGGLAVCRPRFNPMAELLTSAGGPFVTLQLIIFFYLLGIMTNKLLIHWVEAPLAINYINSFASMMMFANSFLLLFNLIPAFPMDGGRILRDTLWFWIGVDRATTVALWISRVFALLGGLYGVVAHEYQFIFLAAFIFLQSSLEQASLEWRGPVQPFSLRERLQRIKRQKMFFRSVVQKQQLESMESFHRCMRCGKTEQDAPELAFRIAPDGHEYCLEHLPSQR